MKTVSIHKAEPIGAKEPEGAHIVIAAQLPTIDSTLTGAAYYKAAEARFNCEAQLLEDTLFNVLPGGTYDRLLALMLQRKATLLIVSHAD